MGIAGVLAIAILRHNTRNTHSHTAGQALCTNLDGSTLIMGPTLRPPLPKVKPVSRSQ